MIPTDPRVHGCRTFLHMLQSISPDYIMLNGSLGVAFSRPVKGPGTKISAQIASVI